MPSKSVNKPSRNRLAARASTRRKAQQKRSAAGKSSITQSDAMRGARSGILPTSGPRAAVSNKKMRKLERKMGHAIKRKMEAEGEVDMKDAPEAKETPADKTAAQKDEQMADIS